MRRSAIMLALGLLAATASGCRTIEIRRPIFATGEVRVGLPARAWEAVTMDGELVGMVVLFEALEGEDPLYMVRNVWHQDLGLIDELGRAYRYLPHHKEPAWVKSGTVTAGVAAILGIDDCELFEVPFRALRRDVAPGELERGRADRAGVRSPGFADDEAQEGTS